MKKIGYFFIILAVSCCILNTFKLFSTETTALLTNQTKLQKEIELLKKYKNHFYSIKNKLFEKPIASLLAQLKRASYPEEFWALFKLAYHCDELIIMHGLAREYIERVGNPKNNTFFMQANEISEPIKDIIRKQYFLMTNDETVLKKDDGSTLTLSLTEVIISRPTKILNSKLNLSNLHLSSLDCIDMYSSIKLEEIDLSHNHISTIPAAVFSLPNLKYLNLSYNKLKQLPENSKNMQELKKLNLSYNQFEEFPESVCELKNLWRLDIDHNQLTMAPDSIKKLSKLRWLLLNNNKLELLPESVSTLLNLHKLDVSNNMLMHLPNFSHLKNLHLVKT